MTAKKAEAKPTAYVVLEKEGGEGTGKGAVWRQVGEATATSKVKAIAEVAQEKAGTFKAVPLSSWRGGVTQAQTTMLKRETIQ